MRLRTSFTLALGVLVWLCPATTAQWVQTNGPYGGTVLSFAVSPNGAGGTNLFAGTGGGGVFVSTNDGTSWTPARSGLTAPVASSLALSGANLFAGTWGSGVFLSTDNGTSWARASTDLANTFVNALAVSDTNLFAGTWGGGVFLSTNNGTSWTEASTGLTNTDIRALAVSGTNLFAGTFGGGVFRSANNGANWTAASNGLTTTIVLSLAVSGTNLFAGTEGGVFLSTNHGTSWTRVSTGLTNTHLRSLAVSPNGAGGTNLFAGTGGGGVFLSTDNGTSWTEASTGLTNTDIRALAVSGTNLFAGTFGGGVFRSTNNGTSWTAVNTGLTIDVYALGVSPDGAGGTNLFAGTFGGGVFLSTDNSTSWSAANTGLTSVDVKALAVSPNGAGGKNLFAGTNGGVFLSTNNGTSWVSATSGLTSGGVQALFVSGTNLFAGTSDSGVFLSTDNGTSWTAASAGLTNSDVRSLAVSGTNLFAGTFGGGVFRSANNGTSWTALNNGLPKLSYDTTHYVSVNAFAESGTNTFAGTWGGVFVLTDNGTSWTAVNAGLTCPYVRALAVSPDGAGGSNLFAGTTDGVFLSTDNATSWTAINSGLANTSVYSLAVSTTCLFAGTHAATQGGVWWRPLSEMVPSAQVIQPVSTPSLLSFNGPSDTTAISIDLVQLTGSGSITVARYSSPPLAPSFSGTPPTNVSEYRWVITQTGLSDISAQIRFAIDQIPEAAIIDPSTVTVYRRASVGTGSFGALPTSFDESNRELVVPVTGFSEFIFGSFVPSSCVAPPPGLVSWWPGDGNAQDLTNRNWGALVSGATFATGLVGQAFSFDGVDDYVFAPGTGIDSLQQLTIEAWVKLDSMPPRIERFVTLGEPNEKAVLRYDGTSGPGQLHFGMKINGAWCHIRVNNVLQTGIFYHVAGTYDGSVMRLYLDGVELDSLAVAGLVDVGAGVYLSTWVESLDGLLDEIAIYNRALSSAEIQAVYLADSLGKCKPSIAPPSCVTPPPGLVSWWDGDGNANDRMNRNQGSLVNGTTFATGLVGQAFSFDGVDDYVSAPGTGIDSLQQLTIEAWVRLNSMPPIKERFVTLGVPNEKAVLRYDGTSGPGQLHFYMRIGGALREIRVNNVLQTGVFYHVAGTYDGNAMRLYLNGAEAGSLAVAGLVGVGAGVYLSAWVEALDGLLDEIAIYDRALSSAEIQAIYLADSLGKCNTFISHGIVLPQGWNMNSSFVAPRDSTLDTMMVKIQPHLVLMKNGAGQIYTPLFGGINTIGKWNPRHGYKIYMSAADTVTITGIEIHPESTPLQLAQGWNLSAYLPNSPMSADSALAGIVSNVVVVKNNAGQIYTPLFGGINTIGQMKPGQGYQMYLTQASTLTYPANTSPTPPSILTKQNVIAGTTGVSSPVHYASSVSNTGANAILFVESSELKESDEVGVWTEKKMPVGSGVVHQGRAVITIWGDNSITQDIIDGAVEGESLALTMWSVEEKKETPLSISSLQDALTGKQVENVLRYETDGVWIARGVKEAKEIPTTFSLSQNYPNPFNPSTTIKYGLPKDVKVTLEVYNILGQRVAVLADEAQEAGYHEVVFQNANLASGVYFYRLRAEDFVETKKLIFLR
jgi:photosystem II stability/assembly factor-like uncharacterized protein